MNRHLAISYFANVGILFCASLIATVIYRKYDLKSLFTKFTSIKEVTTSESPLQQHPELDPDKASNLELSPNRVSEDNQNENVRKTINDTNFLTEVFSTFLIFLIGYTFLTYGKYFGY